MSSSSSFQIIKDNQRIVPNASILSVLTIQQGDKEKILLLLHRQVVDKPPQTIYWYQKYGKDGDSKFLLPMHPSLNRVRQWVAIGQDDDLERLWTDLFKNGELTIPFKDTAINFFFPGQVKKSDFQDGNEIYKVEGLTSISTNYLKSYYSIDDWDKKYHPQGEVLKEYLNCVALEKGFYDEKDTERGIPLYPYGLFEEKELHKLILSKIVAIQQKRGFISHFRGVVNNKKKEDPTEYKGFISMSREDRMKYGIKISDMNNNTLGTTVIEPETGLWNMKLQQPAGKGIISLYDKDINRDVFGEKYYLIKDIKVDTHIIHAELEDLYKRKISVSDPPAIVDMTNFQLAWNRNLYPDDDTGHIHLSDQILPLIGFLGPKIIISDPYGLGDFNIDNRVIQLTGGQKVFLNAFFINCVYRRIQELSIILHWSTLRAKNKLNTKEEYIEILRTFFQQFVKFDLKKITLLFSAKPFHNRHWVAQKDNDEFKIFRVTNSISGLVASEDFEIIPVEPEEKMRLEWQIKQRMAEAEKYNIL